MRGLMMDQALTITSIMRHAEAQHGDREIVSITHDHPRHRYSYREAFKRVRKLANALQSLGLKPFQSVATLAWNDFRHLALYYGISCAGFVCHTINPRLFAEQIIYIANHAEDRCIFVDPVFVPLLEGIVDRLESVQTIVILAGNDSMPETSLPNVYCYEDLLAEQSDSFDWPDLEENAASSLCYTSGTTGNPKGVLYSHRSNVLHSYAAALPDSMGLSATDAVLPVVPMFHANAWGLNYAIPMVGAKYVLPGPMTGNAEALINLMQEEQVTMAAGVPTVWLGLLQYLDKSGQTLSSLERTVVGGAACPLSIMDEFRDKHGVETFHAWGMTETSPLGTLCALKPGFEDLTDEDKQLVRAKQGRPVYGVELKITDDEGQDFPWDGQSFGALKIRGPWVASGYFNSSDESAHDGDGWFETGDVATIDVNGYMQITDRTKDVIKSGGEWISSIELENVAVGHPKIVEAAVIGVPHPKWSERPLLVAVTEAGADLDKKEILDYMTGKVAKWWIPDDVAFVDEIPHTATGKISKLQLRKQFQDYSLPA